MSTTPTYTNIVDIEEILAEMRALQLKGTTHSIEYRRNALHRLKAYLKENETRALNALTDDLGKAPFEGYATELGIIYDEINICLKHLDTWTKPKRVTTPFILFPSRSKIYPSPLGIVLVLSPWNYPLQLALVPVIDAIAAGNCVALKPSQTSKNTGEFLVEMFEKIFPREYCCAFPGSGQMNDWLLTLRWDKIFFTGSSQVGQTVMEAAACHLTPVTLELGGKSPCIVDADANVTRAAQRIAWGKGINAGQTCVAPDYLVVHEHVAESLVAELKSCFHQYYGDDILNCDELPHIVNERHFKRLIGLIENHSPNAQIAFGGKGDIKSLRIEPTCITGISFEDPVMREEIFGPILPLMTYRTLDEAFEIIRHFESPLACYLFTENKNVQHRMIDELQFGGATINDVVIHLANNHMGFGGVGNSGMGAYHGKVGFDCFTHYKSILKKSTRVEITVRVPPFRDKIKLLRRLMS